MILWCPSCGEFGRHLESCSKSEDPVDISQAHVILPFFNEKGEHDPSAINRCSLQTLYARLVDLHTSLQQGLQYADRGDTDSARREFRRALETMRWKPKG